VAVDRADPKTAQRCRRHPGQAAIAACNRCGASLCVSCAVPVRGEVLGPECIGEVLGRDTVRQPAEALDPGRLGLLGGFGLLIAAAATCIPWTWFGSGATLFGAWSLDRRWSMLAAVVSVLGLAVWFGSRLRGAELADVVAMVAGSVVAVAAVLAVLNPPPLTHASIGPWLTTVGGVMGAVTGATDLRRRWARRVA
jgi:B-box zinc finger protein